MNTSQRATILIVPGLRDHVEAHWQTHLQRKLSVARSVVCVSPPEADKLSCAARVSAIQRTPVPRQTLPFRSIVAASTNDPLAAFDCVARLASDWGSELVTVGALGHLNPASGFGEWPMAEALIHTLES